MGECGVKELAQPKKELIVYQQLLDNCVSPSRLLLRKGLFVLMIA